MKCITEHTKSLPYPISSRPRGVSGIYSRNPLNSIQNSFGNKFPKHQITIYLFRHEIRMEQHFAFFPEIAYRLLALT